MSFIRPGVAASGGTPGFFTTNFSGGNGDLTSLQTGWIGGASVGGSWTNPGITSHVALSTQTSSPRAPPFDDSIAHRTGFNADHYSELTIGRNSPTGEHEIEPLTRFLITAGNARGYEHDVIMGSGAILVLWNGPPGNYSPLTGLVTTNCTFNDGDVYRASSVGTTHTLTCNGNTVYSISDGTWTTGNPGMGLWVDDGVNPLGFGIKTYTASNIP